jgi:hypothetical protein
MIAIVLGAAMASSIASREEELMARASKIKTMVPTFRNENNNNFVERKEAPQLDNEKLLLLIGSTLVDQLTECPARRRAIETVGGIDAFNDGAPFSRFQENK